MNRPNREVVLGYLFFPTRVFDVLRRLQKGVSLFSFFLFFFFF